MNPLRAFVAALATVCAVGSQAAQPGLTFTRTNHLGWTNAWLVANGQVEAVVVPSVGRVMQFRFAGEADGPFWENAKLTGQPMPADPWAAAHGSFGGDKTWPAPQSGWNWPPPDVFDRVALEARVEGDALVLTSPVSPRFGIRTVRRVTLAPSAPVMRIATSYEKVSGEPVEVGVWIITQAKDPVATFLPVPAATKFPAGTTAIWGMPTNQFSLQDGLVRLTRDPRDSHKIGNDAESMVWVGTRDVLRIDSPRSAGANYPDDGCSVEIYTNPDPVPYVELETVGPLRRLAPGDRLAATNTYTLSRRQLTDDRAEARRALAR